MKSKLYELFSKKEKYVIGLMSGTSVDGIDAVLVKIENNGKDTKVSEIGFETYPYSKEVRERIFKLFDNDTSTVSDVCYMNFLLGELFARASIDIANKCNISMDEIDLIGSHGQTIYHIPEAIDCYGYSIKSTLQIGDGCVIANRTGVTTVSDFRVADMADGGQGAPLVPYTEFLLFNNSEKNIGLLNLGGIGNITILEKNSNKENILAFDTGAGNMVIDYVISHLTNGLKKYDDDGKMASQGSVCEEILDELLKDPYFSKPLPKTTGREYFGKDFSLKFIEKCKQKGLTDEDIVATATAFTSKSVAKAVETYVNVSLDEIIVSGGGSCNSTLLSMLQGYLKDIKILTQEDLGYNSNSKEAVAFAVLANETISENESNLKSVTGANKYKILGKISI